MATVKYGALELIPPPLLGLNIQSNFFGADIRYSTKKTYSLQGTLISIPTSGVSGIYTKQEQFITGFLDSYLPFEVNGQIVGYPKINSISFNNGTLVQRDVYNIELEILQSGNPFQITGTNYGFTGVSGLFYNIDNLSESLDYTSDFKTFSYSHNVEVQYRTGASIDPLTNAKLIASGLINNKASFPFVVTGGLFGVRTYAERESLFGGSYGVTESFNGTTGNVSYDHTYSLKLQIQENGNTVVTQDGTIKGYDPNKYVNAKSGYGVVKSGIYASCSGFYVQNSGLGTLHQTFLSETRADDINNGVIQYSRNYNDELGISDSPSSRWQYSNQITFDGVFVESSEQGNIQGLGHISTRSTSADSKFTTVEAGIGGRCLSEVTTRGFAGPIYQISKEKSKNTFNGTIGYNYTYSNSKTLGAGGVIKSYSVDIEETEPLHNKVAFNVINQGVVIQSLGSTSAGQRTTNVEVQGLRSATKADLATFAATKYSTPVASEVFLESVTLNYNVSENNFHGTTVYVYGGQRAIDDLRLR